jgi:hypothetical protein
MTDMTFFFLYIDPGSGGYLVQVLIAAVLGIGFFFKSIGRFFKNAWWYIKSLFKRSPKNQNDN